MSGTAIQIGEPVSAERSLYNRIEDTLGVRVASGHDLAKVVETRLPTKVIGSLIRHGLTDSDVWAPSVVALETSNLLVNPLHRQSSLIQIVDIQEHAFDEQLS